MSALPSQMPAAGSDASRDQAQLGLSLIKSAIMTLLCRKRQGLTNAEICRALALGAKQNGKASAMLSWAALGLLIEEGKVRKEGKTYLPL